MLRKLDLANAYAEMAKQAMFFFDLYAADSMGIR